MLALALTESEHAVTGATHRDPSELFDVDMHELARVTPFVAVGRLEGSSLERFPSPIRFNHSETVESGNASTSAISAAVILTLLSASIACTRC